MRDSDISAIAVRIVQDAGGELVGRIRLQKIAFLMKEAGFIDSLSFEYFYYGPYSESLNEAVKRACADKIISEEEKATEWGTPYYIYSSVNKEGEAEVSERQFVASAKALPSVLLELAATALYLYKYEHFTKGDKGNPWAETERRKKFKAANGRLRQAYEVYEKLRKLPMKKEFPEIPFLF